MIEKKIIFQINTTANVDSVGKDVEGISRSAIERGYESWIAFGDLSRTSSAKLLKLNGTYGKRLNGLRTRLLDTEGEGAYYSTQKLIEKMNEVEPNLVILHNIHGYYLNYPLLFSYLKETKVPVIWSLHDCWAFTGHCTYFTMVDCNRWKTECYDCPQRNTYPSSWFLDRSRHNYRKKKSIFCSLDNMTVVTVSNWLKRLVEDSFLSKYPVKRIYNGVRTDIFCYRDDKKNMWFGKTVLMGCAMRWDAGKGLTDYLALSKIISDKYLIVLIGHIDDKKIRDNLPKNIVNIERTENQEELAKFYSRADISMNLSYQETMGLTTVEAMACGTPGIVYNTTASPELITSETGIIVSPGNIKEVYETIKKITSKPKSTFSDSCRLRAMTEFDELSQFSKYIDLYESITQ